MFKKVLVGYDGSTGARVALDGAAALAKQFGSEITALFVRGPLPNYSDLPGEFEGEAEAAENEIAERQLDVASVMAQHGLLIRCETCMGDPAKSIVQHAAQGCYDLIVIGHSGHSEIWGRLLGDTADRISDHAHCSVLVIKSGARSARLPYHNEPAHSV